MHRNISPQSIYIDNENLVYAHFYIGDQGKAKEESLTNLGTQQSSSYQFHAPEGMQDITMKSDIYQFGLVALLLLNKGTPLFSFCFLDAEEIEKKFNPDYINNILIKNKLEYDKKLIEIIVQCLKQNPKDRPETVEIEKKVSSIYRNQRIRIVEMNVQK
ncbi:unnamed protein product [Paramecium octaurelia]|nr:unnamed protein product [Paramecium octaurelia]